MMITHSSPEQRFVSFGGTRWRYGAGYVGTPLPTRVYFGRVHRHPHRQSWVARVWRFMFQVSKLSGQQVNQ